MKCVVVSQPMFFPWVGIFEQIRLCDVFVHYDDVQYTTDFFNRVQIKTSDGIHWLTVPVKDAKRGQDINETLIDPSTDWRRKHLETLRRAYAKAPFKNEMLELVQAVYEREHENLARLSEDTIETVCHYFELDINREFHKSSELGIPGKSTERLLDIVSRFGGNKYVTGHGARNYFNHELADSMGIAVEYINYCKTPYSQLHGDFTPYVSILDLIANLGRDGIRVIQSECVPWRQFVLSTTQ